MKGIILAGGTGSRLFPTTLAVCKQLLPIYDKPTIYYPLSQLMLAGIKEILIISSPNDLPIIEKLLGDGSWLGISLSYKIQLKPEGISQAFIIAEDFIAKDQVCLILGDNIFYGHEVTNKMLESVSTKTGATIFAYKVNDPERYGVIEIGTDGKIISIEEKPQNPKSQLAMTGLYFFDSSVVQMAKTLVKSARGELEITELAKLYLNNKALKVHELSSSVTWLDTGTNDSMLQSSVFVQTIENRQGIKVGCIEEVAFRKKFISKEKILDLSKSYPDNSYGIYVKKLASTNEL